MCGIRKEIAAGQRDWLAGPAAGLTSAVRCCGVGDQGSVDNLDVAARRRHLLKNWSPGMIFGFDEVWIGLEYFCNMDDKL